MERVRLRASPKSSRWYVSLLGILTIGFYVLLLVMAACAVGVVLSLSYWTQVALLHAQTPRSVEALTVGYLLGAYLLIVIARTCFVRIGGTPLAIRACPQRHARLFDLVTDVAAKVGARPITDLYITPDAQVGVWEERAIFMPPGAGRRKVVLGMGALCALTLGQLRCVLAHEYAHFSQRDLGLARLIFRVYRSNNEMLDIMACGVGHRYNPFFWIFTGYVALYNRVSASYLRTRELCADRFAADVFGCEELAEALVATHIEGSFFREVGIRRVVDLAKQQKGVDNLYHFVGLTRRIYARQCAGSMDRAVARLLGEPTGAYDRHPSLADRLERLGVAPSPSLLPEPPSLPAGLSGDEEVYAGARVGPCSAAEELFGEDLSLLQLELSDLLANRYADAIQLGR